MVKDIVKCWKCETEFDLVAADWCDCDYPTKTKVCPHCKECLCSNPDLNYEDFTEAPEIMKKHGFVELWKVDEHDITYTLDKINGIKITCNTSGCPDPELGQHVMENRGRNPTVFTCPNCKVQVVVGVFS